MLDKGNTTFQKNPNKLNLKQITFSIIFWTIWILDELNKHSQKT